jgi:hypothetical protein
MIDLGILSAFKSALTDDAVIQKQGLDQQIHTAMPKTTDYPCVLLELEEIWTSLKMGTETGYTKLKIKASTFSQTHSSRESLGIADRIRSIVDGRTLNTHDGKKGMIRLSNSVIDMPSTTKPLTVQQYFEILVR